MANKQRYELITLCKQAITILNTSPTEKDLIEVSYYDVDTIGEHSSKEVLHNTGHWLQDEVRKVNLKFPTDDNNLKDALMILFKYVLLRTNVAIRIDTIDGYADMLTDLVISNADLQPAVKAIGALQGFPLTAKNDLARSAFIVVSLHLGITIENDTVYLHAEVLKDLGIIVQ